MNKQPIIRFENVTKRYEQDEDVVLNDVSFEIEHVRINLVSIDAL